MKAACSHHRDPHNAQPRNVITAASQEKTSYSEVPPSKQTRRFAVVGFRGPARHAMCKALEIMNIAATDEAVRNGARHEHA